VNWRVH